ncbi:MAG TPA: GGDEF domain-containing protein [Limnochordia bacterium]|nr:GGDEF domain-containing protein [Limnochordia bacterium]
MSGDRFDIHDSGNVHNIREECDHHEAIALTLAEAEGVLRRMRSHLERLRAQALTDELTGLYNRRHLRWRMAEWSERAERDARPLSLLFIDVDDFKAVNDRLGHAKADGVLRELAQTLRELVRATDHLARYGGDEFVVLAPDTAAEGARELAERLRDGIGRRAFGEGTGITLTIGGATYPEAVESPAGLFAAADAALYGAKRAGKDRYAAAGGDDLPEPDHPNPDSSWRPVIVGFEPGSDEPKSVWLDQRVFPVLDIAPRSAHRPAGDWRVVADAGGGQTLSMRLTARAGLWFASAAVWHDATETNEVMS